MIFLFRGLPMPLAIGAIPPLRFDALNGCVPLCVLAVRLGRVCEETPHDVTGLGVYDFQAPYPALSGLATKRGALCGVVVM